MKKQRGITLIALVITIIVLLILAGVSISLTLGDNGILNKAKTGAETHRTTSEEEQILLGFNAYQTAKLGGENSPTFKVEGANVKGNEKNGWTIDFGNSDYIYELTPEGKISEKEKFDAEEWDKTAAPEEYFIWASNDKNSESYGVVLGYTSSINNFTKLRYPSRCTEIRVGSYETMEEDPYLSRSFTRNISVVELPSTIKKLGYRSFFKRRIWKYNSN